MIRRHATTVCLVVLAFLVGLAVNHHAVIKAQDMNRVYELRTYTSLHRFGFHRFGFRRQRAAAAPRRCDLTDGQQSG